MTNTFPSSFVLQDLTAITARAFELKVNPLHKEADEAAREWFKSFNVYNHAKLTTFLDYGKFDLFAALSFPNCDLKHLETCLAFFFWAFSTDDLSDEGALQARPDDVQAGVNISFSVLANPTGPRPEFPYAAMLYDLLKRIRETATPSCYTRFTQAFEDWSRSQVKQSHNRSVERIMEVEEFILMRRATIGGAMVEAMVEYSLDLQIPPEVWDHPIIKAMSDATTDIMTWPNDLCSFNKEQSDGDYQNLVICLMQAHKLTLQRAVDALTDMIAARVSEYTRLKAQLPKFDEIYGGEGEGRRSVDAELGRYLKELEHFVQGTVLWYYWSPRYFRTIDISNRDNLVIPLFERAPDAPAPTFVIYTDSEESASTAVEELASVDASDAGPAEESGCIPATLEPLAV